MQIVKISEIIVRIVVVSIAGLDKVWKLGRIFLDNG